MAAFFFLPLWLDKVQLCAVRILEMQELTAFLIPGCEMNCVLFEQSLRLIEIIGGKSY